jgi:hypothetical protein
LYLRLIANGIVYLKHKFSAGSGKIEVNTKCTVVHVHANRGTSEQPHTQTHNTRTSVGTCITFCITQFFGGLIALRAIVESFPRCEAKNTKK